LSGVGIWVVNLPRRDKRWPKHHPINHQNQHETSALPIYRIQLSLVPHLTLTTLIHVLLITYARYQLHGSMSGITFGSIGDIIAVGQLVWGLTSALSGSRGSAKEYQGLVKELQAFDQALLQVSGYIFVQPSSSSDPVRTGHRIMAKLRG
jgi:hypothetical protein